MRQRMVPSNRNSIKLSNRTKVLIAAAALAGGMAMAWSILLRPGLENDPPLHTPEAITKPVAKDTTSARDSTSLGISTTPLLSE